jgi:hypothetical protein
MSDLLKEIDIAWFSDVDEVGPAKDPPALQALGLEVTDLPAPGSMTPMPLPGHTRLSTEDGNEFSQPDLAQGTVVDAPVPKAPWFSEIRRLVPRRRARPSSLPPIPSAVRVSARIETVADEDVLSEEAAPSKSWWRRRRKR